ncbi:transglycosylase SLT domain-containing protein [candidate division KSB3 bacterium]|uniref:Transglycosylase SLT domain-containing protein n=1 Tax=candidate division KSB3 bacterium TaxID=2044937 RepID=A0A9D5JXM0_9BACT|nr:transglycosylase SLT domain-containing protein [candidate division KSB3 bacterium]MBD3326123.1 transglycosylase SLT domain-containing protein [candidate division KSB3 bacterium]
MRYVLRLSVGTVVFLSLLGGRGGIQPGYAEIYKYVENGVVHYTNQSPEQREAEVVLRSSAPSSAKKSAMSVSTGSSQVAYRDIIHEIAEAYRLHPELVKAIIKVESNYNARAVSPKGAQGLMQLMPATAKRFGVTDSFDPEENIRGGAKFLRYLFDEFGEQNLELVLAGYNAGEEAVRQYGNKIPPYSETRNYVKRVKSLYAPHLAYTRTRSAAIYKYVDRDGGILFTNVPRVQ